MGTMLSSFFSPSQMLKYFWVTTWWVGILVSLAYSMSVQISVAVIKSLVPGT